MRCGVKATQNATLGRRTFHEEGSAPVQRALSRVASLAFPQIFLIVAPANLLVDCLVLTLALMGLKHKNKWAVVKKLGLKLGPA